MARRGRAEISSIRTVTAHLLNSDVEQKGDEDSTTFLHEENFNVEKIDSDARLENELVCHAQETTFILIAMLRCASGLFLPLWKVRAQQLVRSNLARFLLRDRRQGVRAEEIRGCLFGSGTRPARFRVPDDPKKLSVVYSYVQVGLLKVRLYDASGDHLTGILVAE
ncbi:hypothetical protein BCR39DRAFT_598061 [Naematelia encephala]|uniref:Uncharacterized protein n=1 Tax=Naematelia encephala TaxID=71784 RepID=A0A1Y2B995_9TREE|nr:hypothetical protein BCR39DRAFT_598061 [Naematelia encephala]